MKTVTNADKFTDIELLSFIISGKDSFLKSEYILMNTTLDRLLEIQAEELQYLYRLTPSQAQKIENFRSLRKRASVKRDLIQIKCSKDVKDLLYPYFIDLMHEEFYCIYLNRANIVIKTEQISKGGISGTVTDVRIICKNALLNSASGLIVSHNHPSGNLNPSESDTRITQKLKEAASLMDIKLLDHIIIANEDYYSFADNGLL